MSLNKTKSSCWVNGIIRGLNRDDFGYGYKAGATKTGKEYRRIKFDLQIDQSNKITVECFGVLMDEVYVFSKENRGDFIKVPWAKRYDEREGYNKPVVAFDMCEDLDTLGDGSSIRVKLSYQPDVYTNKNGEIKLKDVFSIENFFELDNPVDLDDNEEAIMDLEFVLTKVAGDGTVKGFTIDYKGECTPVDLHADDSFDSKIILSDVEPGTIMKAQGFLKGEASVSGNAEYKFVDTEYGKKRIRVDSPVTNGAKRGVYLFYAEPTSLKYEMSEVWDKSKLNRNKPTEEKPKKQAPKKKAAEENEEDDWF